MTELPANHLTEDTEMTAEEEVGLQEPEQMDMDTTDPEGEQPQKSMPEITSPAKPGEQDDPSPHNTVEMGVTEAASGTSAPEPFEGFDEFLLREKADEIRERYGEAIECLLTATPGTPLINRTHYNIKHTYNINPQSKQQSANTLNTTHIITYTITTNIDDRNNLPTMQNILNLTTCPTGGGRFLTPENHRKLWGSQAFVNLNVNGHRDVLVVDLKDPKKYSTEATSSLGVSFHPSCPYLRDEDPFSMEKHGRFSHCESAARHTAATNQRSSFIDEKVMEIVALVGGTSTMPQIFAVTYVKQAPTPGPGHHSGEWHAASDWDKHPPSKGILRIHQQWHVRNPNH